MSLQINLYINAHQTVPTTNTQCNGNRSKFVLHPLTIEIIPSQPFRQNTLFLVKPDTLKSSA